MTSEFEDPVGTDHDFLGSGLRKALYNYMHGIGLETDVREWFDPGTGTPSSRRPASPAPRSLLSVPATTVPPDLIERFIG